MKRANLMLLTAASAALVAAPAQAQTTQPHLHVNSRWQECSFQLDPSLTQSAWRQFTREAGLVVYFRPLADARPMGKGNFEVSLLQWKTGIDDADAAWNDTFVHPDSSHYLFEGDGLKFPGLMIRSGLSEKTDVAAYLTKAVGANYGFFGGQVQHSFLGKADWAAAARASFVTLYGPEDVDFGVIGADVLVSRTLVLSRRVSVSPYVGMSHYLSRSHEKSSVVALGDEIVTGTQGSFGAALNLSAARLAAEYNVASVRSFSVKIGVGFD